MFNLTPKEEKLLQSLNTPAQIQDFINKIPVNFDYHKDTCMSPRIVLKKNKCHCIEGAILSALALRMQGYPPLILHLKTIKDDYEHVIAVFQQAGFWGAISKTNHGVLRYREPIYKNVRELAISYFHEYFLDNGKKTLREYSKPLDLSKFDKDKWFTSEKDLWEIGDYLDGIKHYKILSKKQILNLRKADKTEIEAGKVSEWKNG